MILKQIKITLFSLVIGFLACNAALVTPALQGMEAPRTPQKTSVVYNPEIQPAIIQSLTRALKADQATVAIDSFILTDAAIINLLIKIQEKHPNSVTVHVHDTNSNNTKTIKKLEAQGITVDTSKVHAKRLAIAFKHMHEPQWHTHTISGSYNLSKSAQRNQEIMVIEVNDSPAHKQHKESHDQGKKRDRENIGTQIVDTTPVKKTVIDNSTYDLHASLAPRIDNTQAGDTLYVASMNYGDEGLHAALLKAAQRKVLIHLLLDTDATAQRNIPLLDALNANGVHIVFPTAHIHAKEHQKIFGKKGIFHQKYLVRVRGDNILTYVSTANATDHAQDDFNVSTFYPNQDEMAQTIIAKHKALAQAGVTYAAYKASGAALPKRNRKLTLSASSSSQSSE